MSTILDRNTHLDVIHIQVSDNLFSPNISYSIIGKVFASDEKFDITDLKEQKSKKQKNKLEKVKNLSIFDLLIPVLNPEIDYEIPQDLDFPHKLFNYQIQGIKFLISNKSALLADQMGTGKTVQSTTALRILFIKGLVKKALIVVPSSLIGVWEEHLKLWAPEIKFITINDKKDIRKLLWQMNSHAYLVSYDTLKNDYKNDIQILDKIKENLDLIILDEAHNIKNPSAIKTKAVRYISQNAKYRWALSGTPLQNNILELISLLEFLFPEKSFDKNISPEQARQIIEPIMIRRLKKDVLKQLPDKLPPIIEKLKLSPSQRQEYEYVLGIEKERLINIMEKHKSDKKFKFIVKQNIIHSIQKLRQICNFPSNSIESPKVQRLREIVLELIENNEKVVIFTNFYKQGVEKIYKYLTKDIPAKKIVQFHGKMSLKEKKKAVKEFKENDNALIFIGTIGSAGEGLTLTKSSYAIFFDMHWNPAKMWQAEDRVHRIGQENKVVIHNLIMEDTIEEKIVQKINEKRKLINQVIDGIKHKEEDISIDDLIDLIGLNSTKKEK